MDINQAQNLIRETFESSFDKSRFTNFVKNLLNNIEESSFTYQGNKIRDAYRDHIQKLERIGKFSDGKKNIDILVITLQKEISLVRARTMQRNFIAQYLANNNSEGMKDAALAAFVSPSENDWRFSLIKMDYEFGKTKTGKTKVKEEYTPAKRWSFLVGPNEKSHTAQKQLVDILKNDEKNPVFEELEKAFDIETVSKEFFDKYRGLFIDTKEELDRVVKKDNKIKLDFEKNNVDTVNFVKKLLGQIVFLYFIQKKGWFGIHRDNEWGTGSKHFIRELFNKKHGDYKNFFNDILEPLFYEALRIDRSHDDGYFSKFDCKIPFLNGGLFDPIGNYDWTRTDIVIPNQLFSNTNKTKEGDIGSGILDVFDRYNFTVKEDEPLEKEVAIDPELIGKVYEKFNAIRPDNFDDYKKALSGNKGEENKFNKKFGVYYTPREIVSYMCQQSLINYLLTELNGKVIRDEIEKLIHFGEHVSGNEARIERKGRETKTYSYKLPENIRGNAGVIDEKLKTITICDPAVGSGAFPVGMMSEIVKTRNVLSVFLNGSRRSTYEFKHQCIENSLFGVDIDSGAVEITKLRLWLCLIVDEQDIKNIRPLPNLDYKIICGNSLQTVQKQKDLFNEQLFDRLEKVKLLFLNETKPKTRRVYRDQVYKLITDITNSSAKFDIKIYFSEVFHKNNNGFNVIITNPPYIKEYVNRSAFEGLRDLPCYQGKMDIWYLFACKSIDIAKKDRGIITFIAQNNWVTSYGASKLRNKVINDTQILNMIDFSDFKIFEAGIQTMIMMFMKNTSLDSYLFNYRRLCGDNIEFKDVLSLLNHQKNNKTEYLNPKIIRSDFIDTGLTFSNYKIEKILNKLLLVSNFHLSSNSEVAQGIVPNPDIIGTSNIKKISKTKIKKHGIKLGDGVFVVQKDSLKKLNKHERRVLKPLYEPTDLERYFIKNTNAKEIIYLTKMNNANDIPNLLGHLSKFKEIMDDRRENKNGRLKYYHLHWPRNEFFFSSGPKIFSVRKCAYPTFSYTEDEAYVMMSINVIKTTRINTKYLTGLLNSKLIAFWLKYKGKMQGNNYQVDKEPILSLPILEVNQSNQHKIADFVTKIIDISSFNMGDEKQIKIREYENQIDKIIYRLYGLAPEEIKIIEGTNEKSH